MPRFVAFVACSIVIVTKAATLVAQSVSPVVPAVAANQRAPADSVGIAGPPVRRIESATAVSVEPLGTITNVRELSNGRVLVNDGARRRLLLLDSSLKTIAVVLDSLTDVQDAYGTRVGALLAYRGDSTLFLDPATYAMLVIDNAGHIARVRSVPRAQDAVYMASANGSYGYPAFDAVGRLVYRIPAQAARQFVQQRSDMPYIPSQPDSAFVVGIHLDTRKIDTLGAVRIPRVVYSVTRSDYGFETRSVQSPLPLVDDWAVLADGTVAFVRGRDYRIDYLNADGTTSSSQKLPFPWTRMDDSAKVRYVDSLRVAQTKAAHADFTMQMIAWSNLLNKPYPAAFVVAPDFELTSAVPSDWILPKGVRVPPNYVYACAPVMAGAAAVSANAASATIASTRPTASNPSSATMSAAVAAPPCRPNSFSDYYGNGYSPPPPTYRAPTLIPATELPDYKPPIAANASRADADGNVWIRTQQMKPVAGGTIFDVVSRGGVLVDRIQLPAGYAIAGFGTGRVVYLSMRDGSALRLAKVRLR